MGIQSYSNFYLPYVKENIGSMLERVAKTGLDPIEFWEEFVNSNVSRQIEKGNPKYLTCSSFDYIEEVLGYSPSKLKKVEISIDEYYWAGWALADLQNKIGFTFFEINERLPLNEVLRLYPTLHEADISKFLEVAENYFKGNSLSNLKKIREARGLSQTQLSALSSVDLRSIQMYEQKRNDINKAQACTLSKLAMVLGCQIEDLLEH